MTTEKEGKKIEISIETQKLNWYVHDLFALLTPRRPTSSWSAHCRPDESGQLQWLGTTLTHLSHRKLNKSPSTVEDPAVLKLPLTEPKLKSIALHFPLGLEVTARNLKGVTIKDALDAIHKQFKKRVSTSTHLYRLSALLSNTSSQDLQAS
jgi:hypothetical protein